MSKQENTNDGYGDEIDLQTLLKNNELVRKNLDAEQEAVDKRDAMEIHGLVEPGKAKKSSAVSDSDVLNRQLDDLRQQLEGVTAERDQLRLDLADRDNSLADRDDQIKRLGQQLETIGETEVVKASAIAPTVVKETPEPANLTAEQAPKIVHPTGEPAKVVKAKAVPKVPTGAKETETAPAVKQPWDAS